jgi:hypothetical protein
MGIAGRWSPACQGGHIPRNLDLMFCPAIIWYETGYSTFTLRQASRRSWKIGQTKPVTVWFLCYENTAQVGCLRRMGRKFFEVHRSLRALIPAAKRVTRATAQKALEQFLGEWSGSMAIRISSAR